MAWWLQLQTAMGLLWDISKGLFPFIIFCSVAKADGEDLPVSAIHALDGVFEAVKPEKTSERPPDNSKVWRFNRVYSRGNDDRSENLRNGAMYETAKMKFGLIVKEEDGKLQIWVELAPTLSTSELQGARLGANYGARSTSFTSVHNLTEAEKAARKAEWEKLEAARVALLKKALAEERAGVAEVLELEGKNAEELKALLAKLTKADDAARAENQETIDRLTKLIAKALAAKKNPGKDERADKLPVDHLKDLLAEAEAKKTGLEKNPELADTREKLSSVETLIRQATERMATLDAANISPRTKEIASQERTNLPARNEFVRFTFGDKEFEKSLFSPKPGDPKGQSLSGVVYVGSAPLPTNGDNRLEGNINIQNNGQSTKHVVHWLVDIKDGVVKAGTADPLNDAGLRMWQLVETTVKTPDGKIHENPGNTPMEKGFVQKGQPIQPVAPIAQPAKRSLASGEPSLPK